jgi:hypothetical protein
MPGEGAALSVESHREKASAHHPAAFSSFRNRIEIILLRDIRKLRGYLMGIDTSSERENDRV